MNKIDKIIKDLKERNDKLLEQYRYRDIRCITLEQRLERLQQELNDNTIWWTNRFNAAEREIKQLKDNWNNLKEYLLHGIVSDSYIITENCMLAKMQELEKGSEA